MTPTSLRVFVTFLLVLSQGNGDSFKKSNSFIEDDKEVLLASWKNLGTNVKQVFDSILKSALPRLIRITAEIELGEECYESLNKIIFGLANQKLWALKFLDASGKPVSGYLTGTVTSAGNYDECVDIRIPGSHTDDKQAQGQYCVLDFNLPLPPKPKYVRLIDTLPDLRNITMESEFLQHVRDTAGINYFIAFRFGICVPSTCTIEDIKKAAKYGGDLLGFRSDVPLCETKNVFEPDSTQIGIIIAFSVFGVIIIVFTLVEIAPNPWLCKGPPKPLKELSFPAQIINAGSLNANMGRLVNIVSPDPRTDCIHGIKFFSMTWVILGHSYLLLNWQMTGNSEYNQAEIMSPLFQIILSGFISVDTFFTVTSFLVATLTIQLVDKHGRSVFKYGLFILNRIVRLVPMMIATTGLLIILPLFGSGPIWHETVDTFSENCRRNWWYNIIFLGNFLEPAESCLPHFWYAICDMQLLPVSLIFLILVFRKPSIGLTFGAAVVGISCVATAIVTYVKDLQPAVLFITPHLDTIFYMFKNCHFMPYVHLAPYGVGLMVGYLFARHSDIRINPGLLRKSRKDFARHILDNQFCFWILDYPRHLLVECRQAMGSNGDSTLCWTTQNSMVCVCGLDDFCMLYWKRRCNKSNSFVEWLCSSKSPDVWCLHDSLPCHLVFYWKLSHRHRRSNSCNMVLSGTYGCNIWLGIHLLCFYRSSHQSTFKNNSSSLLLFVI